MSTVVCQKLVPCFDFEAQLSETTTTLKLKVASPPSSQVTKSDFGNWGFLQSHTKLESSYTHPSAKKSFSRLSQKSLELCTENLGNESGSDIFTDITSIFSSRSMNSSFTIEKVKQEKKITKSPVSEQLTSNRKINNFPPPLSSMSGSSCMQVIRHREGGRLIIEAVEAPIRKSCLQAERSNGRLRLCFLNNREQETIQEEYENECGGKKEEPVEIKCAEMRESHEINCAETRESDEIKCVETRESDEIKVGDGSEKEEFEGERKKEIMGMEKFQRQIRCSGNGGFSRNWKPALWVASA